MPARFATFFVVRLRLVAAAPARPAFALPALDERPPPDEERLLPLLDDERLLDAELLLPPRFADAPPCFEDDEPPRFALLPFEPPLARPPFAAAALREEDDALLLAPFFDEVPPFFEDDPPLFEDFFEDEDFFDAEDDDFFEDDDLPEDLFDEELEPLPDDFFDDFFDAAMRCLLFHAVVGLGSRSGFRDRTAWQCGCTNQSSRKRCDCHACAHSRCSSSHSLFGR
jgi:hypothetical protein